MTPPAAQPGGHTTHAAGARSLFPHIAIGSSTTDALAALLEFLLGQEGAVADGADPRHLATLFQALEHDLLDLVRGAWWDRGVGSPAAPGGFRAAPGRSLVDRRAAATGRRPWGEHSREAARDRARGSRPAHGAGRGHGALQRCGHDAEPHRRAGRAQPPPGPPGGCRGPRARHPPRALRGLVEVPPPPGRLRAAHGGGTLGGLGLRRGPQGALEEPADIAPGTDRETAGDVG